jgi:hypothetical protein
MHNASCSHANYKLWLQLLDRPFQVDVIDRHVHGEVNVQKGKAGNLHMIYDMCFTDDMKNLNRETPM